MLIMPVFVIHFRKNKIPLCGYKNEDILDRDRKYHEMTRWKSDVTCPKCLVIIKTCDENEVRYEPCCPICKKPLVSELHLNTVDARLEHCMACISKLKKEK